MPMLQRINRNQIFYIYLLVTLFVLLIISVLAEQQNRDYWQDYTLSENVVKMLANNENQEAGVILQELLPRHPESYQINWYNAICLANNGEYQKAQNYYDQALKLMPALVNDAVFLWRYGENLYNLGQTETARQYLQQCSSNSSTNQEIKKEVDQLLEKINNGK